MIVENQQENKYAPQNLSYAYDDKISLTGIFQRMNNFLKKGFEDDFLKDKGQYERDQAEIPHVEIELAKEFEKNDELMLVRENHSAVLKELKRMQEDKEYVSEWAPKSLEAFQAEKKCTLLQVNKDNKKNLECVKASITL